MKRVLSLLIASAAALLALENPSQRSSAPAPFPVSTPFAAPEEPGFQIPEDSRAFVNAPEGGDISIEGLDEELRPFTTLTLTFPTDMVGADRIDAEGSESPIAIWPPVDAEFVWSTQTQGFLTIKGPLIPGQIYRFRLREGLKDASGAPLPVSQWGAEMRTPEFAITEENYGERSRLNARPQVPLEFNYPVRLSDAAKGVWFQNRATRERFPAEVLLNVPDGEIEGTVQDAELPDDEKIYGVRIRPGDPLPVGAFYDLVVEGIVDAYAGRGLAYPRVFPLGPTVPIEVDYVSARNEPLEKPSIEVKFDSDLDNDPLPENAVTVTPAVPNMKLLKSGRFITVDGDFAIGTRYTVQVSDAIRGASGYGLAKAEKWGATFKPRRAAIYFPDRTLRERSALGFRFAFYQINTGGLEWKLAPVPLEQLSVVSARLSEFDQEMVDEDGEPVWTEEGKIQHAPTELLIPVFGLTPVATGTVPASPGDAETLREISWKPESGALSGPMLLEMTGKDAKGRVIGNRALVYFGENAITRKVTNTDITLRVARMSDGQPVPGALVKVLDKKFLPLATGTTDSQGLAVFSQAAIPGAEYFVAEEGGTSTLQPVSMSTSFPGGYLSSRPPPPLRSYLFTDRPLYRPGQKVSFKGLVREETGGVLKIPSGQAVKWTIERNYNETLASGETKVDAEGGWSGSWTPPEDGPLGYFSIKARVGNVPAGNPARFQIEEFRNPPFSVVCEAQESAKTGEAVITAESQYFHGAPNAGATVAWTATWVSDSDGEYYEAHEGDEFKRVDLYSEHRKEPTYLAEVSGDAALDGNGQVTLRCEPPFKDPGNRARCQVVWKVDITGPDGQTITGGAEQTVPMLPTLLGVKSVDAEKPGQLAFEWDAEEFSGEATKAVKAELFHVVAKAVKERIAPNVYRYRNSNQFNLVEKRDNVTERSLTFTPKEPGRYVLVLSPIAGANAMPVSEEAYLSGDEPSENPVQSDTAATVLSLKGGQAPNDKPWKVGETARLSVLSPTPGVAWVSVETDRILDTFTVPLSGNTSTIEIPVKPEYEPNAFVSVYLLRPGGGQELAGEMFGYTTLNVTADDRQLALDVKVDRSEYEPRQKVTGSVKVTAAGKPVAGADLAISVVDESILTLGGWSLPSFLTEFFPARSYGVVTYSALLAYVDKIAPSWLTSKGFVIGDGGAELFNNVTFTRKEFKPILLWLPSVKTDAAGLAKFSCETPDNLTKFRVVAVGQTKRSQFGAGDTTFNVSKNLLIEPALPRFVREGDEVELRAVARQKVAEDEKLVVRCTTGGGLELQSEPLQEITAAKDAPVVVRFKARAGSVGKGTAKFEITSTTNKKLSDAVEITLPIAEPVILKKEAVGGRVGHTTFRVAEVAPGEWENARGTFAFAMSTTPWLAKLMGLPYLIDYPHGCFEQKTSRLLAYTYLGGLLEYVPDAGARKDNYAKVIEDTLGEIETSLLPGGRVPYWPNGTTGNDYVTIQTAWCVAAAEKAGCEIPERLAAELPEVMEKIATQKLRENFPPTLRGFALFVYSLFDIEDKAEAAAVAGDIYLQRDQLTGEGRAMLAIAMHNLGIEPEKQKQLLKELPSKFDDIAFNPETFSSMTRTEALCLWARLLIEKSPDARGLEERLEKLMESSASLSTQENLWLLVAFDSLLEKAKFPKLRKASLSPAPQALSTNQTAAAWTNQDISRLAGFVIKGLPEPKPVGSFVLSARYRNGEKTTPLESRGMRVERVVKNLTDASRTGSGEAPFKLGDQLLISYRFSSDKPQAFVAVEDLLPAGVEVVNPNLAMFGKYYAPPDAGAVEAALSYSEMRDQQTNLYFDRLPSGSASYAVLARATAVGAFIWPATQIQPMYDSRFFGRSPSSLCVVAE
jgi:uncharacterized protein YfaS (alpha-2-macroglobulin family)